MSRRFHYWLPETRPAGINRCSSGGEYFLIFVCERLCGDGRDDFSFEEDLDVSTCRLEENFTMIATNFSAGYAAWEIPSGTCTTSLQIALMSVDVAQPKWEMDVS